MQQWLHKNSPIDKEDLERHDKWLCMMWPRLHLLRELLAPDGAIFISIDDNEQHHLRMIMDEIFGAANFIVNIIWQKKYAPANDSKTISDTHDFILAYAKNISDWNMGLLPRTEEMDSKYKNRDDDPRGPWKPGGMSAKTYSKSYDYSIALPSSSEKVLPPKGKSWSFSRQKFDEMLAQNRIWFGVSGQAKPQIKQFLSEVKKGAVPQSWWPHTVASHNQIATKEIEQIFGFKAFETPKPTKLIKRILKIANVSNDDIVLDSFAGCGTTAHAVLELNKEDGGNRKFILIECENYADTVTAERVRKVINGYSFSGNQKTELMREKITWSMIRKCEKIRTKIKALEDSNGNEYDQIKKEVKNNELIVTGIKKIREISDGVGGSFNYCTLGDPIDIDSMLAGDELPLYSTLAAYLIHTASGISVGERELKPLNEVGLCYITEATNYYLLYEPNVKYLQSNKGILNEEQARKIQCDRNGKRAIVFGVGKYISQKVLTELGITFCQLPYEIH